MVLSMTGFVAKSVPFVINNEQITVTVSIKTLNSRFCEITCKLPYVLAHIEHLIHKKLKEKLARGSVQCTIHLSSLAPFTGAVQPSLPTVAAYLDAIQTIQKKFGAQHNLSDDLSLNSIIALPHVFETPEEHLDTATRDALLAIIETLIDDVIAERKREGSALQKDLEGRVTTLRTIITELGERATIILKERRDKLQRETFDLLKNASTEAQEHHLQQLHAQLERMDIHEELVRFKAHLEHLELCLKSKEMEKGKKIDFILQELFRETNTIASKCLDAHLGSLAIASKVELEKAREQAQNIV